MNYEKLPRRLQNALKERGHSVTQIEAMTPEHAVTEYAAWHLGYPDWGEDFIDLIDKARGAAHDHRA